LIILLLPIVLAVVVNGKIKGIWKRKAEKDNIVIKINYFKTSGKKITESVEKASDRYECFFYKRNNM